MTHDSGDSDWEQPRDDEDRRSASLEKELATVSAVEDRKILWGLLAVLALLALYFYLPSLISPLLVTLLVPLAIFGGLGWVIYRNLRGKRAILLRRGLRCSQCGYLPHRLNASGAYAARKCPRCQARLATN